MGILDRFRAGAKDNLLFRVLFDRIGSGQIVWTGEDKEKFVSELHDKNADLFSVIDYVVNGFNKVDLVVKNKAGDVVETGDLYNLIKEPNPSMSTDEFMSFYLKYKLVTGDSFIYTPKLTGDRFIEMWVLPAQYTKIVSGGYLMPVAGYTIENGTMKKPFTPEDVLHIKETNLETENGEQLYGMSRLTPGKYPVDINQSAQEASAHRFQNRGADSIITAKGRDNARISKQNLSDFKRQVRNQMSGTKNEGGLVATMMDIELHKLGVSAVDLGIFEGQRMTLHQICNLYHVPPILMDPTTGNTYNNIREAHKAYYKDAVLPEIQIFVTAFNRFIGDAFKGEYIDFDTSGIEALQTDYESMMKWLKDAPFTENEKREMLGREPIADPEMDKVWIAVNKIPIDELTNPGVPEDKL